MKKVEIHSLEQYYSNWEPTLTTKLLDGTISTDGVTLTVQVNSVVPSGFKRVSVLYYNRLDVSEKSITIYDVEKYEFTSSDTVGSTMKHDYILSPILSNRISSEVVGYGTVEAQILTSELNPGAIDSDTVYGKRILNFPYIIDYISINKNTRSDGLYRYGLLDIPIYNEYSLPPNFKYWQGSLCYGASGTLYKALVDTVEDPDSSEDWVEAVSKDIYTEAALFKDTASNYGLSSMNNILITKYAKEYCLFNAIEGMWFDADTVTGLSIATRIKYLTELANYFSKSGADINTLLALNELYSTYLAMIESNRNNPVKT